MSQNSYTILPEQASEDALHATRLLQVEERPFQRVTRNLLGKESLLRWTPPTQLPSPPPDGENEAPADTSTEDEAKRACFREDILLDFAALESSVLRIQLIQNSNARERERYAAEKAKILSTAQNVRDSTHTLRAQLAEAQRVLQLRKGYDELAAKLIDPKKLKPRADTTEEIAKLEKEIEDLEAESAEFENVWVGRKEAFEKVVAEGEVLKKVIKGIKDEPEPEIEGEKEDERMEDDGEGKGEDSHVGTPAPGGSTPMPGNVTPMVGEAGDSTPMPGGSTPLPEAVTSPARPTNKFLDVDDATRGSSPHAESPMAQVDGGDVEMGGDDVKALEAEDGQENGAEEAHDTDIVEETEPDHAAVQPEEVMDES